MYFSPLLVFVNSKSGDNQGVKFLRRFKQLLNPAQVFDLISTGPGLGLRLFRHFDPFRILVCSGDGSVGWVVSEIDRLGMNVSGLGVACYRLDLNRLFFVLLQKQCQIAVLPLGTGNDLARVLGWGPSCDDDAHLPQLLERYEKASTKMLDRWSVMVYERDVTQAAKLSLANPTDPYLLTVEDKVNFHLHALLQADDHRVVVSATKNVCDVVLTLLARLNATLSSDEQLEVKCDILKHKLEMLLDALNEEEQGLYADDEFLATIRERRDSVPADVKVREKGECEKTEKEQYNKKERRSRQMNNDREALQYRSNSLKRAIRNIVKHSENNKPRVSRRLSTVDCLKSEESQEEVFQLKINN